MKHSNLFDNNDNIEDFKDFIYSLGLDNTNPNDFRFGDYIRQYPKDKFSIITENKIQIMKAIIYKKVTKEGNDYKGSAQEKIYFLGIPVFCSTKELNER